LPSNLLIAVAHRGDECIYGLFRLDAAERPRRLTTNAGVAVFEGIAEGRNGRSRRRLGLSRRSGEKRDE
jgi:hypothetical protein